MLMQRFLALWTHPYSCHIWTEIKGRTCIYWWSVLKSYLCQLEFPRTHGKIAVQCSSNSHYTIPWKVELRLDGRRYTGFLALKSIFISEHEKGRVVENMPFMKCFLKACLLRVVFLSHAIKNASDSGALKKPFRLSTLCHCLLWKFSDGLGYKKATWKTAHKDNF